MVECLTSEFVCEQKVQQTVSGIAYENKVEAAFL